MPMIGQAIGADQEPRVPGLSRQRCGPGEHGFGLGNVRDFWRFGALLRHIGRVGFHVADSREFGVLLALPDLIGRQTAAAVSGCVTGGGTVGRGAAGDSRGAGIGAGARTAATAGGEQDGRS